LKCNTSNTCVHSLKNILDSYAVHFIMKIYIYMLLTPSSRILRKIAPELFSTTTQDARINYLLVRYWSQWYSHTPHVLLNSIQMCLSNFEKVLRELYFGAGVCLTKNVEFWMISQYLYHQRYHQYFGSQRSIDRSAGDAYSS
jgi:hypothetical protein